MPLSPLCQVREGAGSFVTTLNGVDVSPGASISIRLTDAAGVGEWFLQVIGTDELSSPPALQGVNELTHQVTSPSTVVTLTFPSGSGHAVGFRSEVTGTGGPVATTFGIYSLTTFATRVGFVTETREGNPDFGWATKLNPLIRSGGGGGGGGGGPDNYTLTDLAEQKTIPEGQTMLFEDDVVIDEDGDLIIQGSVTATRTEDNFSVLHVPQRSERVVQRHDELLFTNDMVVDGQLTVDGQITDATPYDGNDILMALSEIAPDTPAILGSEDSLVSFLDVDQARALLDVPSFAEMDDAINAGGGGGGIVPWGPATFTVAGTFILNVNAINRYSVVPGLVLQFPQGVQDGDEIQIKEISGLAGTAPFTVLVDTGSLNVAVENIDLDGFTQTDVLTEYKTWIKYKYDASGTVWRIVGAAYQLP